MAPLRWPRAPRSARLRAAEVWPCWSTAPSVRCQKRTQGTFQPTCSRSREQHEARTEARRRFVPLAYPSRISLQPRRRSSSAVVNTAIERIAVFGLVKISCDHKHIKDPKMLTIATVQCVQARRVGESWRSGLLERPSGREDGRTENGGLPKQTPELIHAFKPLF